MAGSPSHRFGQIVGGLLEEILCPVLLDFCHDRGLYLDRHGDRVGVRAGRKVSWTDKYGNTHDLDFVIEKDGSATAQGKPVAFIEAAWRRYTKHSRNKAQEIQGAVLPIAEKYDEDKPFLGAVLAGEFTRPSLDQLRSVGFEVLYLPYQTIVAAFAHVGIDARFDETTPDADFEQCVRDIEILPASQRQQLKATLLASNSAVFDDFFTKLRAKLDRLVARITILPLFGDAKTFGNVLDAESFVDDFDTGKIAGTFQRYEIAVQYSNKDEIRGIFNTKDRAKDFLAYVTA